MAASVRASNAAQNTGGGAPVTVTVTKPTGTVDGDLLLALVATGSVGTVTTPSGWTLEQSAASGSSHAYLFSKVAVSEGASFSFTTPDNNIISAGVTAIKGPAIVTPVGAKAVQSNGSSTTATAPTITPLANSLIGLLVASFGATPTTSGYGIVTSSPTFVEEYDTAANGIGIAAAFGLRSAATATGTGTATLSSAATSIGMLISVSPGLDVSASAPLFSTAIRLYMFPFLAPLLRLTARLYAPITSTWRAQPKRPPGTIRNTHKT